MECDCHRKIHEIAEENLVEPFTSLAANAEFVSEFGLWGIPFEEFDEEDELYTIIDSIHTRSTDIVDLIQEVRSVLQRFIEEGEAVLSEKPLAPIVRERVKRTRRAYPEAEIELDVRDTPEVIADELLDDVLNNLLLTSSRA